MAGRRRVISGLEPGADPRAKSDALRKVVNTAVQGSAADLIKQVSFLQQHSAIDRNTPVQRAQIACVERIFGALASVLLALPV